MTGEQQGHPEVVTTRPSLEELERIKQKLSRLMYDDEAATIERVIRFLYGSAWLPDRQERF